MSLDPLALLQQAQIQQVGKVSDPPSRSAAESFAETLNRLESQGESAPIRMSQAHLGVHLAHLSLLRGLFVEEDSAGNGLSAGLAGFSLQPSFGSGQKIDPARVYSAPAAPTNQEPGQEGIHRLIDRIAGELSLAPELVRSVVATESGYRTDAVSPVGAQGLMQLMPETARELGVEDSFDAEQNLLGGSRYLKQLLEKYDGDLDKALAAYNWGQGNVDRKGLEQMPQETRDYLVRVKQGLTG